MAYSGRLRFIQDEDSHWMDCEKCWADAYLRHVHNPHKSQAEHYQDLLFERRDNWCTPEEQNGETLSEENGYNEDED